jgi:hypothetical protein
MKRIHSRIHITALLAALSFIVAAPRVRAQGTRYDGVVQGEQGIPASGATIVVCTQPANVVSTPCTPLANLFTDTTLSTPAPNPLNSDGLGNFHFYAAPGMYTLQIYGPGINTYTMTDVLLPINPSNAQFGSITATSGISALTLNLGGNLSVGGNASVTGTLTAGALAANLAASSNAQLKGTGVVLYVDTNSSGCGGSGCSDSNDGKSLGSAFATIDHALCSLPTGNCANHVAGNGTIYYTDGSAASSTPSAGVCLMGILDPNYSNPSAATTCSGAWLTVPNGTGGISLIGIQGSSYGPNTQIPRALITGGSAADRNHPGIWLSGTNEAIYIANAAVQYPGRGIIVGECSNNARTGCPAASVFFDNDTSSLNSASGNGPAWDITGASFWIRLRNCGGSGLDSVNTNTSDNAAAVLVDGRTNAGAGLIFIDDFDSSNGGIKFYAGANGGSLSVTKLTTEAQNGEPAVWFAASGTGGDNYVTGTADKIAVADALAATPGVEVDIPGFGISANDIQGQTVNTVGPMHIGAQYTNALQNQTVSPQRYGQTGAVQQWNYGKRDDVQRSAALTTVRFANQVTGSTCASWFASQSAGTITKTCAAIADPFGGANAGQASSNNSTVEQLNFTSGSGGVENVSLSVGEYIVAGVWTRSQTANGYSGNPYAGAFLGISGTGFSAAGGCDGDSMLGDGQWTWNRCIYKVTAIGTNPGAVEFGVQFNSTYTVQAYAPVLNFIAPGTLSDNEAYAYENALKTYDSLCAVGASCGMEFNPVQSPAFETETANPAQSGIFRLADGDAIAWRNHANSADVSLSKNSSDQLVAAPFASPTFFSPIIDSTSGASGLTFRNTGSTVWTANASGSALSFNFNAHLGETTVKLAPFGGESYAGLLDNYGMAAGFVSVTESSGTMSFDAGLGNTFEVTLNANATSSTLSNAQAGQWLNFIICQPASGGPFTFAWPSSLRGAPNIGSTGGKCTEQEFVWDGTQGFAVNIANQ